MNGMLRLIWLSFLARPLVTTRISRISGAVVEDTVIDDSAAEVEGDVIAASPKSFDATKMVQLFEARHERRLGGGGGAEMKVAAVPGLAMSLKSATMALELRLESPYIDNHGIRHDDSDTGTELHFSLGMPLYDEFYGINGNAEEESKLVVVVVDKVPVKIPIRFIVDRNDVQDFGEGWEGWKSVSGGGWASPAHGNDDSVELAFLRDKSQMFNENRVRIRFNGMTEMQEFDRTGKIPLQTAMHYNKVRLLWESGKGAEMAGTFSESSTDWRSPNMVRGYAAK